jgi:hypothetical protein
VAQRIDTLLLLALPAAGKSVIRRYLSAVSPEVAEEDFHLGPMVQLDDFPYVHLMRRISDVMGELGHRPAFFELGADHFRDPADFGTLIHLLNDDFVSLHETRPHAVRSPGEWIMGRFETARARMAMPDPFAQLDEGTQIALATAIHKEAGSVAAEWSARRRPPGSTVVIELSRGGPEGSALPLDPPHGYAHALPLLSQKILRGAAVLYVLVTPEGSRRRNKERARPGAQASTLHHEVPDTVMRAQFGLDDMKWLIDQSDQPGTITVRAHQSVFHLPVACFDNRRELSWFRGEDTAPRPAAEVGGVHAALREAFTQLTGGS